MNNSRWLICLSGLALGLALSVRSAPAQSRGGSPGGGTAPTGGGTAPGGNIPGGNIPGGNTGTTTPTTPTTPGQAQPPFEQMPRAIFLSGKVMLDDGTMPAETVVIERVCGANHWPEAYTDSKGRFSFQLGQNRQMLPDASVGSGNMDPFSTSNPNGLSGRNSPGMPSSGGGLGSDPRLMGCELRAALPGYRSDVVNLAGRRVMDNPDVGTIILHRVGNVQGTTISATTLDAPKDAKKAYEKGVEAMKKQKWPDAQKSFEKAVGIYPKYAAAWYELGMAYQQQKNGAEAQKAFASAIQSDPRYLRPYLPSAALSMQDRKWQEVADTTEKLIRLDPVDFPNALMFNAIANINLRNLDAAEKSAREAVKLDTDHQFPRAEYVLGFILANKQDYPNALQLMKSYVEHAPNAPDAEAVKKQIAQLEKVAAAQPVAAPAEAKQ